MKNSTKIKYNALFLATLNVALGFVCVVIIDAVLLSPFLLTEREIKAFWAAVLGV